MEKEKHLSVVLAGRNDDYGGNFKNRLRNCVLWTYHHLCRQAYSSEIVFVNYNPLPDPSIETFIDWPESNDKVRLRIITINNEVHQTILGERPMIKNVPVLEYIAKNAGIRRSTGNFILVMNPDIIIHHRLFENLNYLKASNYYRTNRFDFDNDGYHENNLYTKEPSFDSITRIWLKGHIIYPKNLTWQKYRRMLLVNSMKNIWKGHNEKIKFLLDLLSITIYTHNVEFSYHCNASGDFMLASREMFHRLRGYRENSPVALHTDSIFVIQCAAAGLKEKIFFYPIFHKEHERRYNTMKADTSLRQFYLEFQKLAKEMLSGRTSYILNNEDWGLKKFELPELAI
ncbi:MAG: hypothetical protein RMJ53_02410 [Chitinophagales bacterium]|nr:hypothetical protein [Chitinophagales bacterium]MDW8273063.1 hypothetical protein [Chitinophagales bacterium]